MLRRTMVVAVAVVAGLAGSLAGPASGQGERLTRLIVAFPPGGPVDFVARTIAEPLGKELGTRVIVEKKPGGNGSISAETVARAPADGGTIWLTSVGAVAINPVLYDKLAYDVRKDFAPVSLVVSNDELPVVNAGDPASTVTEFIANAKKPNNGYALFVPAKTPPETVAAINRATRAVLATPAVYERLAANGAVPMASSAQELVVLLRRDTEKWGKLIREKKITAE